MELKLKSSDKNLFPIGAILVRGSSAELWLRELQAMKLTLASVTVYPLPGLAANSVWGCLVVGKFEKQQIDIGRNSFCQSIYHQVFIPEHSFLYPSLPAEEVTKLFKGKPHFLHPEIGLVELVEAVKWDSLFQTPELISMPIRRPELTAFIPSQIKTFHVKALRPEEALQSIDGTNLPYGQKFKDKPLNPFEKAKLFFYRQLFSKGDKEGENNDERSTEDKPLLSKLEGLRKWLSGKESNWTKNLQRDFEELEKRNQKHLDRLVDLLKKNPAEALKYAVPLDNDGTGRGGLGGNFNLEKRWLNFSLFDNFGGFGGGGGTAMLSGDAYSCLYQQYMEAAQALIKQRDYHKAAFVYLKLLKDPNRAAQVLEEGGLYAEAAAVYLKQSNNKLKAAECFEKGAMYTNAIELHKELNNDERVGDLYLKLYKKKEAFVYYQKVVDIYTANHQYLKAAQLYKNKMENEAEAQALLLKGWRLSRDAFNCLNSYFSNYRDAKQLGEQMQGIYQKDVKQDNREVFLRVLQHQYGRNEELKQPIRDMAYEIVVQEAKKNPSIVSELKTFNKDDKQLIKDTLRFKVNHK